MKMIIATVDDSPLPSVEELLAGAQREFGADNIQLRFPKYPTTSHREFWIYVEPEGESPFSIAKLKTGQVKSDGTMDQDARVASMVRGLLPADYPRTVALEARMNSFVDLFSGITPEEFKNGWRDLSEGNFP